MTENPYYSLLELMDGGRMQLAVATLKNAEQALFQMEGRRVPVAGWAGGLSLEAADEGGSFLCAGGRAGWFVLCRLEER